MNINIIVLYVQILSGCFLLILITNKWQSTQQRKDILNLLRHIVNKFAFKHIVFFRMYSVRSKMQLHVLFCVVQCCVGQGLGIRRSRIRSSSTPWTLLFCSKDSLKKIVFKEIYDRLEGKYLKCQQSNIAIHLNITICLEYSTVCNVTSLFNLYY